MKISKQGILKKGNGSLAFSALFFLSSLSCPCPTCIGCACIAFLNSMRQKLSIGPSLLDWACNASCKLFQ